MEITSRGGAQGTRAGLFESIQRAVSKAINVRRGKASARKAITAQGMISTKARGYTAHMALNAAVARMERDETAKARKMNTRGLPFGVSANDDGEYRSRAWRRCRAARAARAKSSPRQSKVARRMRTSLGIRNTRAAV